MAEQEGQPEGIEFSDMNGGIALQDFAEGLGDDDDSNVSDFTIDQEYQDEIHGERKLEEQEVAAGDGDPDSQEFGNDDSDSQVDYFQNPIQQHNRDVQKNNKPVSSIIPRSRRTTDPIVTLSNTTLPTEKQECGRRKKKKADNESASLEEDLEEMDPTSTENTKEIANHVDNTDDISDNENNTGSTDNL
jgi:hypothetical protein